MSCERWRSIYHPDDAIDLALSGDERLANLIDETLDRAETLILLARSQRQDYERRDKACRMLADHLADLLGHDNELVYDVLRELSGMMARYRWRQHLERLEATREELAAMCREIAKVTLRAESLAHHKLEEALADAGLIKP